MSKLTIRQIDKYDLERIDSTFKSEFGRTHADDLQDQSLSEISFFVAWLNGNPVGHALVRWLGPREEIVSKDYPDCPEIYRLKVLKEFRSQGIATVIIRKCENEALKRDCLFIGLGTDPDISAKDNLYRQSGYKPSTVDSYTDTYKTRLDDGTIVTIRSNKQFLIKRIGK
ncbi:MAG: GNAT family N-acetyltransferase [Candidatus Scalindua rubra]|uniref:Acetyltransferase (GNAT) family protein n=1 Tax=Candidatus Scalindua brodae TaxID=237368 RepID=A0A0B0EDD7_9BACT|nr:MAG: Acetyltransferase (GNAT) family protein [Candidatus Scalindua brodae]MBZ0107182.1 GNAT family N-acetyltransferase [Candidatus Scalindua rubra]TWU38048.1 Acetyltransferase (GNAT) family protein [Candidatus Brocadiaceae bacterium S225]